MKEVTIEDRIIEESAMRKIYAGILSVLDLKYEREGNKEERKKIAAIRKRMRLDEPRWS